MIWFGFSINILTFVAAILAIGFVDHEAIVELESIQRHRRLDTSRAEAARNKANLVGIAVIATIAVLRPVSFKHIEIGRFCA